MCNDRLSHAKRLLVLGILVLLMAGCSGGSSDQSFTQAHTPLLFTTTQGTVTLQAYVADTEVEWTQGLGGVTEFSNDQAMLFIFPERTTPTFWMKDVAYPLDLVWVQDNVVIGVQPQVLPEAAETPLVNYRRYNPTQPITWVVELPAGQAAALGITLGTRVAL